MPLLFHPIAVTELPALGRQIVIKPSQQERRALAKEFNLIDIETLVVRLSVKKAAGPLLRVDGLLEAKVVQACCITLEPVESHLSTKICQYFTLNPLDAELVVEINMEEDETPDPVIEGEIDLGLVVSEHLGLNINPYPRKPGATLPDLNGGDIGQSSESLAKNPFRTLSKLKNEIK